MIEEFCKYIVKNIAKLDTPVLNHYFKRVSLDWDLYNQIDKARIKIGLSGLKFGREVGW